MIGDRIKKSQEYLNKQIGLSWQIRIFVKASRMGQESEKMGEKGKKCL